MTLSSPPVEVVGASHSYARTTALQRVDLRVNPGEVVAVTGRSGGGKSTLLQVAAGLLVPLAGDVRLLGHDLRGMGDAQRAVLRRRHVGLVLQFGQLVPDMTLQDNVALSLLLDGADLATSRTAARAALEGVGIASEFAATPAEVSGGQAQRVAVARALITSPRVVFADEPVASLDAGAGRQVLDLLLAVARREGGSVLLVTHDNTAAALADREVRLVDGAVEHDVVLR